MVKVKYGESWSTLEQKYPGIKNANKGIRVPKAGMSLDYSDRYDQMNSAPVLPVETRYNPTVKTVPTTQANRYDKMNQTVLGIGNKDSRYNPFNVPIPQTATVYNASQIEQNKVNAANAKNTANVQSYYDQYYDYLAGKAAVDQALSQTTTQNTKGGQAAYYDASGKLRKKNVVHYDAKGRPIHNWKALYGIKKSAAPVENVIETDNAFLGGQTTDGINWRVG